MPYPTFTDTMADISIELNDREIYNDIRSKIDITEETTTVGDGTPAGYNLWFLYAPGPYNTINNLLPGESRDITLYAKLGHTNVTWLKVWCRGASPDSIYDLSQSECVGLGGNWYPPYDPSFPAYSHSICYFPPNTDQITVSILSQGTVVIGTTTRYYITIRVVNTSALKSDAMVEVIYQYLAQEAIDGQVTVETMRRTLTVRATDATSIAKNGRRVMNLTWPLGQTQDQMQSLVEGYLERYKGAVAVGTMRIQGSTDALVVEILTRKVSDRITINHTTLSMVAVDFFINSVDIVHDTEGLLEATWQLEQVRVMESASIFTLDTSLLDGPDILGW
jgi:hypothetical protein